MIRPALVAFLAAGALAACDDAPEVAEEPAGAPEAQIVVAEPPAAEPETTEPETTPPAVGAQSPEGAAVIGVETAGDLDAYLLDPAGRPAYLFSTDTPAAGGEPPVITCSPECQTIWPLVITDAPPVAGEGVDASKLAWHEDGPAPGLVTYDGWPLYHFERDDPDGPPHGHGNQSYGGQWLLMGADAAGVAAP